MPENHLAFHIHHDFLAEYIHHEYGGLEARDRAIKEKSCYEKRRRLMREIPDERLPAKVLTAAKVVREAVETNDWLWIRRKEAELDAVIRNSAEMVELHNELCPECPWDGKTIFPEYAESGVL